MSVSSSRRIEKITKNCFFVQNALSLEEQRELAEFIKQRVKGKNIKSSAMVRSAKTLPIGEKAPSMKFSHDETDPPVIFVKKMVKILGRYIPSSNVSGLSAAAIRYPAPEGRFPPHIDHCNDGSFVFLTSLGRTARFSVKDPDMEKSRVLAFGSGDALVFDPSSEAKLLHSVDGIEKDSSAPGSVLERAFPELIAGHRIGVQCRVSFSEAK